MTRSVAIVTGASGGMGRAVVERLSGAFELVLMDVDRMRLETLAGTLDEKPHLVAGDLADPATIAEVVERLGSVPLGPVVHTAGLSPSMADARRIIEVNLVGTARLTAALLPHCIAGTVFVAIASMAGHAGDFSRLLPLLDDPLADGFAERLAHDLPPAHGYALSKYGVLHHVRRSAKAWGARGGRIVSVSPGLIETPMGRAEFDTAPAVLRCAMDAQPISRMGRPAEIADAVAYLISDKASFITGTDLLVDGGSVALQRSDPATTALFAG